MTESTIEFNVEQTLHSSAALSYRLKHIIWNKEYILLWNGKYSQCSNDSVVKQEFSEGVDQSFRVSLLFSKTFWVSFNKFFINSYNLYECSKNVMRFSADHSIWFRFVHQMHDWHHWLAMIGCLWSNIW